MKIKTRLLAAIFAFLLVLSIQSFSQQIVINSLTPQFGSIGTQVTIEGSGFRSTQAPQSVSFNTITAPVVNWSDTAIIVTVPSGLSLGDATVKVNGPRGFGSSNGVTFTVKPGISQISPTIAPVHTPLTITGTSFGDPQGSSTITIGNINATPSAWHDTQITVLVPDSLPAGSADVVVTVNTLASTPQAALIIPVITADSPTSGPVGTLITLTGTSFGQQQGTSTIAFNGTSAAPTTWTNTSIVVPVPAGASLGPIVATINGVATNGLPFSVSPRIIAVGPIAGAAGSLVVITGTTFGQAQGFGGVTFNGVSAAVQSWSDSSITAIVPANATTGNVVVTTGFLLTSNGANFSVVDPLTIVATPSISSNDAGWNASAVTVSFQCSGGLAPISCPSAQTIAVEGANQVVSGTASDSAGNTASTSVAINLDETPPAISLSSPTDGTIVSRPTLRVTGVISDSVSGVARVACNGTDGSVGANSYVCNVPLTAGTNLIQAQAIDFAGNTTLSNQISITYSPIQPAAIFITPTLANMLTGEARPVRIVGDLGQSVSGATWTISDPTIVGISTDDPPQLTALAPGTTTLTATFSGLTASMTVNVFAGTALPFGTPLWSADPMPGGTITDVVRANPVVSGDPDVYMIDGQNMLRAFTADGQQLWSTQVGDSTSSGAPQLAAQVQPQSLAVQGTPKRTFSPAVAKAFVEWKQNIQAKQLERQPFDRFVGQSQRLKKMIDNSVTKKQLVTTSAQGTNFSSAVSSINGLAAVTTTGTNLLIQTVSDNNSGAINAVYTCLDDSCNTKRPSIVRIDNASQQPMWQTALDDGPYQGIDFLAIAPDNTIFVSGGFIPAPPTELGDQSRAIITALDGETGQPRFSVPITSGHEHFTLVDIDGTTVLEDDTRELGAAIGPMAVMPDGSMQALISSFETSETRALAGAGSPCINTPPGSSCTIASSDHEKLQLLVVQPDGSFALQAMQSYDADTTCVPPASCGDPGTGDSYFPGEVIPDGQGGTIASWTKQQRLPSFHRHQILRHISSSGGSTDLDLGVLMVPSFFGEGGKNARSLVLGQNSVFAAGDHTLAAVDLASWTQTWSFEAGVGKGVKLLAATSDQGLFAAKLTSDINFSEPIESLANFDSSGLPTLTPAGGAITNSSYSDLNLLLATSVTGQGELLSPAVLTQTDAGGDWTFPMDTAFLQRAPERPHPVNFRILESHDAGGGFAPVLGETDAWDSSTKKPQDLKDCTIREVVTYPTSGFGTNQACPDGVAPKCFFPPSPPWPPVSAASEYPNPTIPPEGNALSTIPGSSPPQLGAPDTISVTKKLNTFVQPYSASSFEAKQQHQYRCPGMTEWADLGKVYIIRREIKQNAAGKWMVVISKTDVSVTSSFVLLGQ